MELRRTLELEGDSLGELVVLDELETRKRLDFDLSGVLSRVAVFLTRDLFIIQVC